MCDIHAIPMILFEEARAEDGRARGRLLDWYRNYLRLMARSLLEGAMRARLDPSDLIQDTFLKAHGEFEQFAGATEPELVAWLRKILARNIADQAKHLDHAVQVDWECAFVESEKLFRRAISVFDDLVADFPSMPWYRKELVRALIHQGQVFGELRSMDEALSALRRAIAVGNATPDLSKNVAMQADAALARVLVGYGPHLQGSTPKRRSPKRSTSVAERRQSLRRRTAIPRGSSHAASVGGRISGSRPGSGPRRKPPIAKPLPSLRICAAATPRLGRSWTRSHARRDPQGEGSADTPAGPQCNSLTPSTPLR
jgi:DNA-directed RNA polymerase specialized sigma24 family protein